MILSNLLIAILTLAIVGGQLIKISVGTNGGATLLDVAVLMLCIAGLLKLKLKLKKPPLFIKSALFFILIAILSLLLTPLDLEFGQYFTSFSYTIRFSSFILLGWLIYAGAFPNIQKKIQQIFVYSGAGLAILGLLQFIFLPDLGFLTEWGWDPHYFRTASTFLDPNFAGSYFTLTLVLLTSYLLTSYLGGRNAMTPRVFYILFAITYLALLTTFSRGAYLAFLTSFLALSFLQKSLKLAITTILLFALLLLGFSTYHRLVAQPRGIDRFQSAEFRLGTWQQGWQLFSQHPILGVGFNSYRFALKEYGLGDKQFLKSHGSSTNDSSLLYVAATTGTVGLVSFLFFLISFWSGKQNFTLRAGIFGLLAQSLFANTLFYPPLLIWIILLKVADIKN